MGSTASISTAKNSLRKVPSLSKLFTTNTSDETSLSQERIDIEASESDLANSSKKTTPMVVEKLPMNKPERTTLTAIRLVLEKQRFMVAFLDMIQESGKREYYEFYEALESLKKITPSSKTPSMNYNFKALICSDRTLQDFYFNPRYACNQYTTDEEIHKKVVQACEPLLQYQDTMINIFTLHNLITTCQNALLVELIPEFDEYVESKYFKQVRIIRTMSTKEFNEDFDRCVYTAEAANKQLAAAAGNPNSKAGRFARSQSASFSMSESSVAEGEEGEEVEDDRIPPIKKTVKRDLVSTNTTTNKNNNKESMSFLPIPRLMPLLERMHSM